MEAVRQRVTSDPDKVQIERWKVGDILGFAIDLDAGVMRLSHQGQWHSGAPWPRLSTVFRCQPKMRVRCGSCFDHGRRSSGNDDEVDDGNGGGGSGGGLLEAGYRITMRIFGPGFGVAGATSLGEEPRGLTSLRVLGSGAAQPEFHVSGGLCHEV